MTGAPLPVLVLRPAPGNAATLARIDAAGLTGEALPLFTIAAVAWSPPDPESFDALLLTSANALRHGGAALSSLSALPTWCVGQATAAAARDAGFVIARCGDAGVAALLAGAPPARLLWLSGERVNDPPPTQGISIERRIAYRAAPLTVAASHFARDAIVLVHSAAAGERLAALAPNRARLHIIAISSAAASACGSGWASVATALTPDDTAMVALARQLCQKAAR